MTDENDFELLEQANHNEGNQEEDWIKAIHIQVPRLRHLQK